MFQLVAGVSAKIDGLKYHGGVDNHRHTGFAYNPGYLNTRIIQIGRDFGLFVRLHLTRKSSSCSPAVQDGPASPAGLLTPDR